MSEKLQITPDEIIFSGCIENLSFTAEGELSRHKTYDVLMAEWVVKFYKGGLEYFRLLVPKSLVNTQMGILETLYVEIQKTYVMILQPMLQGEKH